MQTGGEVEMASRRRTLPDVRIEQLEAKHLA
jgi:hypothetical protein